jgi:hypothetical protein
MLHLGNPEESSVNRCIGKQFLSGRTQSSKIYFYNNS